MWDRPPGRSARRRRAPHGLTRWEARRLILGKHSGRNALRAHLLELGFMTNDDELRLCYSAAMALADAEKQVTDRDLLTIVHQVRRGNITDANDQNVNAAISN